MDVNFFEYLQRLEMMAFFSGYPFIYALVIFIFGSKQSKSTFGSRLISLLPFGYALVGTLFLGLQFSNLYPDYSIENIKLNFNEPYLKIWGILSLLFWIPAFSKKKVLSLLHSLPFFFFLAKELLLHLFGAANQSLIHNEMKIYTDSLLLNTGCFFLIAACYLLFKHFNRGASAN